MSEGGQQAGGSAGGTGASSDGGGSGKGGADPAPVPYAVFAETNAKLKTAEERLGALSKEIGDYGKGKFEELQAKHAAAHDDFRVRLGLTRAGVQGDASLDYLAGRYATLPKEGRPAVEAWATTLRGNEPGFFGASTGSAGGSSTGTADNSKSSTTTTTDSRKSDPEAGTRTAGSSTQNQPLSEDVIKRMSQAEFDRRWDEISKWYRSRGR